MTINLGGTSHAGQRHGHVEFVAQDIDRAAYPGLASGAETVDVSSSTETSTRTERQRAHNVLSAANSAIKENLDRGADGVRDLRQHRNGRWRPVELSAAVVGNNNRSGAAPGSNARIVDVEDSLEDQRPGPNPSEPCDVVPAERTAYFFPDPL